MARSVRGIRRWLRVEALTEMITAAALPKRAKADRLARQVGLASLAQRSDKLTGENRPSCAHQRRVRGHGHPRKRSRSSPRACQRRPAEPSPVAAGRLLRRAVPADGMGASVQAMDILAAIRDKMGVATVVGEPISSNGVMVVPMARIFAGGGGTGTDQDADDRQSSGQGLGFGLRSAPGGCSSSTATR
jgi:hypothetical protein